MLTSSNFLSVGTAEQPVNNVTCMDPTALTIVLKEQLTFTFICWRLMRRLIPLTQTGGGDIYLALTKVKKQPVK